MDHRQRQLIELAGALREGGVSRRRFLGRAISLGLSVSAAASFLAACSATKPQEAGPAPAPAPEQGGGEAKPEPGRPEQTIKILAIAWPQSPVEQKLADELFTPATGIKVIVESQGYTFNEQKALNEVASKSDYYDIYQYDSQWIGRYVFNGALERLDTADYLGAAGATISHDDFYPEIATVIGRYPTNEWKLYKERDYASALSSPLYGLPWSNNCQGFFYNKEYFKAAGLVNASGEPTPPQTWDEFREMALVLQQKLGKDGIHATAASATPQADYISMEFFHIMWAFGGELWNPNTWQAAGFVNSPETVKALEFFSNLFLKDKVMAPDTPNWDFDTKLTAMLQGKVAMCPQWVPLLGGLMELPDVSQVVGQYGHTVIPGVKDPATGQIRRYAQFGSQGIGINAYSKSKQAAWQYLQWLLSRDIQLRLSQSPEAGFGSSRLDLKNEVTGISPWHKAFVDSVPFLRDFWNNEYYPELLDIQQRESSLAFSGRKTPQRAMDDAAIAQQAVYDRRKS